MNILRKGAVALAAMAAMGTTAGVVAAETASASTSQVITAIAQETTAQLVAPNVVSYTFNLYQPSVVAPGYRLYATATELCAVRLGSPTKLCNWRITKAGVGVEPTLTGNNVAGPSGGIGAITGGTGAWRGARGIFRAPNLIPGAASVTLAFSTQ